MHDHSTRVFAADAPAASATGAPGESRIGAYRLVSRLGQGGMGEVWLGERADAAYTKKVAIKFIATFFGNREALEWFRRERQALARLEHAHIARLLDGGETEDGRPFLVMEYVDGVAIDAYCEGLPLEQILELFLQLCSAVEHAHRALIVHRDIKPANVLVTGEGQIRLLDFGIAKEMAAVAGQTQAQTETLAYTLHYASPEQMQGGQITVASDIYSLGALLYRLLSGKVPHAQSGSALDQLRASETGEPTKPSRVVLEQMQLPVSERRRRARRLNGDLDDIALKCLRHEPERRYGSVRELIEDIGRYQAHEPVLARRGSAGYRASRFLRRHWLAIGAAAAVLLTLTGGLLATYWQAQLAERQRALAQKRFDLSRGLVQDVLFDFQDRLADVPGTINARRMLVDRAKTYLEKIAVDAQDDPGLLIDLAAVERRLGDISGNPDSANIGDTPAARKHYQSAIALSRRAVQLRPDAMQTKLALGRSFAAKGGFDFWTNDLVASQTAYSEAIPLLEASAKADPAPGLQREVSAAVLGLGDVYYWNSELPLALRTYDRACKKLFAAPARSYAELDAVAGCHIRRADTLGWMELYNPAESEIVAAVATYANARVRYPDSLDVAHSYVVALTKQGEIMLRRDKRAQALAAYSKALEVAELAARSNPDDLRVARDVALTHSKRGDVMQESKNYQQAIADYLVGLHAYEALRQRDPAQSEHERDLALSHRRLGAAYVESGATADATLQFDAGLEIMRRRWQASPGDAAARRDLAIALADRLLGSDAGGRAQRCAWAKENFKLWRGLEQQGLVKAVDTQQLEQSRTLVNGCVAAPRKNQTVSAAGSTSPPDNG